MKIFLVFCLAVLLGGCKPPAEQSQNLKWEYNVTRLSDGQGDIEAESLHKAMTPDQLADAKILAGQFLFDQSKINYFGTNGWELVSAQIEHDGQHMVLIFKRPLK